jgi:hypothetical protein
VKDEIITEPLGSDVMIIDVDNRFGKRFFVGKDKKLDWKRKMDYESAGALNHYMYGKSSPSPSEDA